jgi:aspartyl-tRNA(Asn)/glutamyl-tRNA(Gln) amidotransferase subunit C
MSISRADVVKVSLLARLQLTDEQLNEMTEQLGQIVGYVEQLGEVPTEGVQPMAQAIELRNAFAEDIAQASLPCSEALANAPHHSDEGYLVPAVLGD